MFERLESFGGEGEAVLFAHANGYPPGSYRQFFAALQGRCRITAYKHRPLWGTRLPSRRLNWNYFAEDMINTLKATQEGPIWVMGHSMGAAIAVIAATGKPQYFKGLILIDPVFLPSRHTLRMRLTPKSRLHAIPMVRKTLNRPNRFADHEEAFDFHRRKRPYTEISDEVLWDYVHAGTRPAEEGGLELAFGRDWEAGVYASPPWVWPRLLRLRMPTLGLRGEHSQTLSPQAMIRWAKLQPGAELHTCPGGHLLPLEEPVSTAAYVIDFLDRQAS